MPKKRGKKKQRFQKRLLIVCEGSKEKSEEAYLTGFIKTCKIPATVNVEVIDTKKNTGKELVREAEKLKEFDEDEVWVVYDKDGYTQHPATFEMARTKGVNIAFSAISFEIWILLHFRYTSMAFNKSEDVIRYMKDEELFEYSKNLSGMYQDILSADGSLETAIKYAVRLQKYQYESNNSSFPYDFDCFTNLDELITAIRNMEKDS